MNIIRMNENLVNQFWRLRRQLFEELGEINNDTNIHNLEVATKEYYLSHINKDLISWGILNDNKIISCGSLCLFERVPYQENLMGKEGYILNIYTCPNFRKKGLATLILNEIIKYSSENQLKRVWLNSSINGKSLYIKHGFIEKSEMELLL